MNFVTALLTQREIYPDVITDEVIDFCKNIFGKNEFHFAIEDMKALEQGRNLLIVAKTSVGSIYLTIHPHAKNLESPISLSYEDLGRGQLNYDVRNFNGRNLVSSFATMQNENGFYRAMQGYGSDFFGYTFCSNENILHLKEKYGNDWYYKMRSQEEIPYDDEVFEIKDAKSQITTMKDFFLYDDVIISRLKADRNRNER